MGRALLHHVVKAVVRAVRQTLDKGVLPGQAPQQGLGVGVPGDGLRHLHVELVRKAHHSQKLLQFRRQRVDHGRRKHPVDVRLPVGQGTPLREGAQAQVDRREPALAGIEQLLHLPVGQFHPAPARVGGKLGVVEPQLLRPDLVNAAPQPEHRLRREKPIPPGHQQMDIGRQAVGQCAEKVCHPLVPQQMEIVDEDAAGRFAAQGVAEVVGEQAAPGGVRRAVVLPQKTVPAVGESFLHAFPEDGEVVRVDADPDHGQIPPFRPLLKIPVHRRGLAVAHGRDDGGQGTARDGPQALLQPL